MPLTTEKSIIIVIVAAVCTFATRLFPFALFGGTRQVPKFIQYLAKSCHML